MQKNKFIKDKMKKYVFLSVLILLGFVSINAQAIEVDIDDTVSNVNNTMQQFQKNRFDTICVKYKFSKGDKLTYRVESFDSLSIDYDIPLIRGRYERVVIECDSVGKNGHFYLSQSLTGFMSYESKGEIKDIERRDSPWEKRKAYFEIDSAGNRYSYSVDDSTKAALTPGGAFAPFLIQAIGNACKYINGSWHFTGNISLPENGYPMPVQAYSALFKMKREIDTLDEKCIDLDFVRSGQGSVSLLTTDTRVRMTNVINSGGNIMFSKEKQIPIYMLLSQEQKLTILYPNDTKKIGWHYSNSFFTLENYEKGKAEEPIKPIKEEKKKKK